LTDEDARRFPAIPPERERKWIEMLDAEPYLAWSGLRFEEIRLGYARIRQRGRPELLQGAGVVHGGAIAALIDTAAVGAVFSALDERPRRSATISMQIQYLGTVRSGDLIGEARVRRRGRTVVFLDVDALGADGAAVAHGEVAYLVTI
jgi:uncharacterized protein (TIGR00369 family)